MSPETLTPERILEATEDVLRRYGPAKATVVDVARALGVSHGSVYRHFPTKVALREAVTQRWLDLSHAPLEAIAAADGPAPLRLGQWLDGLVAAKRRKAGLDPELFATYTVLVDESSGLVDRHIEEMVGQMARIITAGLAAGELTLPDGTPAGPGAARAAARAVWDATSRFHNPVYAAEWTGPEIDAAYAAVRALVLTGLTGPAVRTGPTGPTGPTGA
ncbi:transcriptional regulator, TetR family [Streptomyces sp. DvalAA-14]|uniref:TetR/AcrR family transcriptional regulator n=1 Tax=unclassified Streptomyces TaxID=2593676 RepID=UPI00081B905C|nr:MULTISPECIES: TetR family transcriptional regulator [unclassified Streptomyces]MYS19783.1 TetR family transcriptional regulator [Streptomyces sp. SID4948]SCD53260.1 transcriptional regulator, TetR family [Streptomyces sp. DvalAA-14]